MKNTKIIRILILGILLNLNPFNTFSQDYEFDNFWDFRAEQMAYFDSISIANNGEMEGTGYVHFMRWLSYWQEAVHNDGDYDSSLSAKYEKYIDIIYGGQESTSSINVIWDELGPVTIPGNKFPYYNYYRTKGTGRCYFIEFDPQNPNKMFTGSPSGGLFYSTDGGETWTNGGTDFLPNPGIAHMQVHPQDSDVWFITTGEGHGYPRFTFSYGIFRTIDHGINWEAINSGLDLPDPSINWWRNYSRKILIDPNDGNILFAVFKTGIYKTENAMADAGSVQWELVQEGDFRDIHFKPNNTQVMYASGESMYWSQDSGDT